MFKKASSLMILILIAVISSSCSKYSDVRSVLEDSYTANEEYIKGLEAATTPQDIATAMNRYCDKLEPLAPRIKEMSQKYPEVNIKSRQYPSELNDLKLKGEAQHKRMEVVMKRLMPNLLHPDVMKSFQRFTGIVVKMQ